MILRLITLERSGLMFTLIKLSIGLIKFMLKVSILILGSILVIFQSGLISTIRLIKGGLIK